MKKRIIGILLLTLCFGCEYFQPKQNPEALARVGDTFLYPEDVNFLKESFSSEQDSIEVVGDFIEEWVRKQSLLQNALNNLSERQILEIDRKVDAYKESLVLHLYETKIVKQQLDSFVNDKEIERYYNEHKEDFVLKEPILRYVAVKTDQPFTKERINEVNEMFQEFINTKNDAAIAEFCSFEAISCSLNTEKYVSERTFYETFSTLGSTNRSISLKANRLMQYRAGNYYYLYRIIDKKNRGYYPKSYVAAQIKERILRDTEQRFLDELKANIYEKARINNQVEIYD